MQSDSTNSTPEAVDVDAAISAPIVLSSPSDASPVPTGGPSNQRGEEKAVTTATGPKKRGPKPKKEKEATAPASDGPNDDLRWSNPMIETLLKARLVTHKGLFRKNARKGLIEGWKAVELAIKTKFADDSSITEKITVDKIKSKFSALQKTFRVLNNEETGKRHETGNFQKPKPLYYDILVKYMGDREGMAMHPLTVDPSSIVGQGEIVQTAVEISGDLGEEGVERQEEVEGVEEGSKDGQQGKRAGGGSAEQQNGWGS
ncbi:hypothetical protein HDU96_001121, partial [Phlyctochytrium bullatum]